MSFNFGASFRSFWHAMTSNDRHASHDSPYRTGSHVPLNQNKHAPLTSVATSAAMDSQSNLGNGMTHESAGNGWATPPVASPTSPYTPGMRSSMARQNEPQDSGFEPAASGEIQMQSFQEGLPPPPPVSHSWKRIDRWAEDHYPELYDQLAEGCTQNDLNELEHELDVSLPIEVRESLQCHDGQERGGRPTGIIFSCMLLDCEEIVQEWRNWKTVNDEYLTPAAHPPPPPQHERSSSQASSSKSVPSQGPNPNWRQELLEKQDSQPPRAIQKAYAHPGWIPLARDWGGNNLAVDLAPGPAGKWGQVIIFGRDYDCKVVVARSWSAFIATVADDISSPKTYVEEESQELKLKAFRGEGVEPDYLNILRWRMDQKYGRRMPKKMAPNGIPPGPRRGSPYGSPTEERGRSPQRFPSRGVGAGSSLGLPSPRLGTMPSPLSSQVTDNSVASPVAHRRDQNVPQALETRLGKEKLVEAPTPTVPGSNAGASGAASTPPLVSLKTPLTAEAPKETLAESQVNALADVETGDMKDVAI